MLLVEDSPVSTAGARWVKQDRWRRFSGTVLALAGAALMMYSAALITEAWSFGLPAPGERSWAIIVATLTVIVFVGAGWLLNPRRPVILFLRPHDDLTAGERFQEVLTQTLDKRFRVVLLADQWSNPISNFELHAPFVPLGILTWIVMGVLFSSLLGQIVGRLVAFAVVGLAVGVFGEQWRRTRGGKATFDIRFQEQIPDELASLRQWAAGRGGLGRQVIRVSTATKLWREMAFGLAHTVDVLMIDVSKPGEGLLWELETFSRDLSERLILIADRALLAAWQEGTPSTGENIEARMLRALQGKTILILTEGDPKSEARFARALRQAIVERVAGQAAG